MQITVNTHNRILFSLENERNADMCYNRDAAEDMGQILDDSTSRMMVARGLERGSGELLFNEQRVSIYKMKTFMEIDDGNECIKK